MATAAQVIPRTGQDKRKRKDERKVCQKVYSPTIHEEKTEKLRIPQIFVVMDEGPIPSERKTLDEEEINFMKCLVPDEEVLAVFKREEKVKRRDDNEAYIESMKQRFEEIEFKENDRYIMNLKKKVASL